MALGKLGEFAGELRRRHVIRVAVVYGMVAWLVAQIGETIFPALNLPEWSLTLVVVLLILGFPIAIVLAWAFDLTPAGVQRTPSTSQAQAAPLAAVPATAGPVLVALPFEDRSSTADQQFLGDGITDELITGLAQVPGLRVVSRTTAFALRKAGLDVREIGQRLGVTHIIEGSVRIAGERLRVAAQLVSAQDGLAIWSGAFDRMTHDVLAVQEEIARALIGALQQELGGSHATPAGRTVALLPPPDEAQPVLQHSTSDLEAYTLYLRGRQQWNLRTADALGRAIEYFEEALARDPSFAHAHAGLADCWAILMDYGLVAPFVGMPVARRAAAEALRLGANLAEAHAAAALVAQLDLDWPAAEAGFRAALARNASYASARHRLGLLLAWLGRIDEARLEMRRALEADPLSSVIAASRGWVEYYAREFDDVVAIEHDVLTQHPDSAPPLVPLAVSLLQLGRPADAAVHLQRTLEYTPDNPLTLALLITALTRAGDTATARALYPRLQDRAAEAPYAQAIASLAAGDRQAALAQLERALELRSPLLAHLKMEPLLDALRGDARFQRLLDATGLTSGRAAPHLRERTPPAVPSP